MADVSPDDIAYVECHGTGTVVGDPLEIDALTRAFRTRTDRSGFCAIGSVKTQHWAPGTDGGACRSDQDRLGIEARENPAEPPLPRAQPEDRLRRESVLRQHAMPRLACGRSIPGSPRSIRSVLAVPTLSSCSKNRRRRPRWRACRIWRCSRYRRRLTPHCVDRSSVTSLGLRVTNRPCRTFALPAPAAERISRCGLRPLWARKSSCEKRSSRDPATATRLDRRESASWPFCSPGRRRNTREWERSSIDISRYFERKSIAAPRSWVTVWGGRSETCSSATTRML